LITLKSFNFRKFSFISKNFGNPVKSRDVHLFPDFSKKRARQNMACHGKSRDFPPFPRKSPDKVGDYIRTNNTVFSGRMF
jgi:hypothetical protein